MPPNHVFRLQMLLERLWKKPLYSVLEHIDVQASTNNGLELVKVNEAPCPVIEHANQVDEECL